MNPILPDIPQIDDFLASMSIAPGQSEPVEYFAVGFDPARDAQDRVYDVEPLCVYFDPSTKMTVSGIRRILGNAMNTSGHPSSDRLSDLILAIVAVIGPRDKKGARHALEQLLAHIVPCDLSQYFAFRIPGPGTFSFQVGDFQVGPLDVSQLTYRSNKAGSDYAQRYADRLKQLPLCISRLHRSKVIAWESHAETVNAKLFSAQTSQLMTQLITEYFHETSQLYFEQFFDDLKHLQVIPQALGAGWLEVESLLRIVQAERVAIYLNIEGQNEGWVSPATVGFHVDLGGAHKGIPQVRRELEDHFGFIESSSEVAFIENYCSFLAEAAKHANAGRPSLAFLYHVIALDLLLGEQNMSNASVTKRSAALVFTALGRSYSDLLQECTAMYAARSKFVHEGIHPNTDLLSKAEAVTRELALVLFRIRLSEKTLDEAFLKLWRKRVQVLVAKLDAHQEVDEEELRSVGAATERDYGYLDLKAILERK